MKHIMDSKTMVTIVEETNFSPWALFSRLTLRGRVFAIFFAVAAAAVVTFSGLYPVSLFEFISAYITVFFMLWIAVTDAVYMVMPNKILLTWLMLRIVLMSLTAVSEASISVIIISLLGAFITGLLFLAFYYLSKRTLGGGDVKLSFVLGLSLTLVRIFNAVFYGVLLCGIFATIGMLLKRFTRKDSLPLGPFLFVGTVAAYLM